MRTRNFYSPGIKQQALQSFMLMIGLLICVLLLSACQTSSSPSLAPTLASTSEPSQQISVLPAQETAQVPGASPEALTPSQTVIVPDVDANVTPSPQAVIPSETPLVHDETPIRFTFPTPIQAPVSLWRPPLYDVPWSPGPYDHYFFTRPIAADEVNWPLADYRYGGTFSGTDIVHTGIDIDAPRGTAVLAAGAGTVYFAGNGLYFGKYNKDDPYGLAVVIEHKFGYKGDYLYTVYAHMDRIDVVEGQQVETGTQLGIVGLTGNTTGPHLHFEVRIGKNSFFVTRNPELWLSPPEGWGVLVGQLKNNSNGLIDKLDVQVKSKSDNRIWKVITYGNQAVNGDDYYKENLVLSDLPAGDYEVGFFYAGSYQTLDVTISAGGTTYFTYHEKYGFQLPTPTPASPDLWLKP